jgi:glycosyltransferase involved in cell wall biosynthesis
MKILIPYDIKTTGMNNPYLFSLIRELVKMDSISNVIVGYGWLYEDINIDVIHLHWPELLVKSQISDMSRDDLLQRSNFDKVLEQLRKKKRTGSKIITTIHNEKPHTDSNGLFSQFYSEIYSLSDGFIHMGSESEKLTKIQFGSETEGKASFIIPHGDYSIFPSTMERDKCREKLKLSKNQKVLLSFGAIRTEEELNLGIDAFQQADIDHSIYIMAGKLPFPYKSQSKHFITRKKLYRNYFNKKISTVEKVISPEEVQIYLKSADVLLIPRFNTLNSGNVALGFTFGKVIVGPDYGVIGETLNKTKNPVFDPYNINSVSEAIRSGFKSQPLGLGEKNLKFAQKELTWETIAKNTAEAYQAI